jgi:hypothetical protein
VEVAASIGGFTKTGGTIYGGTAGGNSNRALAGAANHPGHAVCVASIDGEVPSDENTTVLYYRDTTSGPGDHIDTSDNYRGLTPNNP